MMTDSIRTDLPNKGFQRVQYSLLSGAIQNFDIELRHFELSNRPQKWTPFQVKNDLLRLKQIQKGWIRNLEADVYSNTDVPAVQVNLQESHDTRSFSLKCLWGLRELARNGGIFTQGKNCGHVIQNAINLGGIRCWKVTIKHGILII